MANDEETVREVYEECKSVEVWDLPDMPMDFARRFLAAHEREMAAKVAAHQQWRQNYHERLAAKDEMARLKAALKPVMEFAEECEDKGFMPLCVQMRNAVREAQRIYKKEK